MRTTHMAAALLAATIAIAARADEGTTFSGKIFADYSWRRNEANKVQDGTGLDVKRFYFTVDHGFNETFSVRFRTDIGDLTKHLDVFVKNAYLEARLAPELVVRAGAADLPWVPFVEDLYGYRYVENVLVDRTGFGTSADWGLHVVGKLGGGVAGYAASASNGRGYGDPTRAQAPTGEARVHVSPVKGLTLAVGGLYGKLGQNVVGTATPNTASRLNAVIAYVGGPVRLGVDGFWAKDATKAIVTGTAPEDKALGISGWAAVAIAPKVSVFGRYDHVQPNKDTNSSVKDDYFNAGVEYRPIRPVNLALVYKHDQVKTPTKVSYDEVGVFTQASF